MGHTLARLNVAVLMSSTIAGRSQTLVDACKRARPTPSARFASKPAVSGQPAVTTVHIKRLMTCWTSRLFHRDITFEVRSFALLSEAQKVNPRSQLAVSCNKHPRTLDRLGRPREMTEPDSLGG
jgi:hypothetical protein